MRHVWDIFCELTGSRSYISGGLGGAMPTPIPYAEIDAWSRLTDYPLSTWEIRALKAVDAAYLSAQSKETKTPPKDNS